MSSPVRHSARPAAASLIAAAALLVSASAAAAAPVSVTTATGQSDPVAYIPRVFTVSGTGPPGSAIYMKQRPAGGAGCAPTAYADPGRLSTGFYGLPVDGAFSFQRVWTWDAPGDWMFCIWVATGEMTITPAISQTVTFRTPAGRIATSISPRTPQVGQRAEVTVAGATEAPRRLWLKIRPASGGECAPNYDADAGQSLIDGWDADGTFHAERYTWPSDPGEYIVCSWLAGSSYDPWPIAGPQAMTFNVKRRPPVVASAAALNCPKRSPITRFHAGHVKSVCARYRFSTPPAAGTKLTVSYVAPTGRTYKTVTSKWPSGAASALTAAPLAARAYRHRRGRWQAILRVAGQRVKTASFRVM